MDHIIILDGTLSTLTPGQEGNCGLLYKLLIEDGQKTHRTVYYEQGLQWQGWKQVMAIVEGRGLNRQIRRAYGWLASHYREGDRIFLFGYSRGAYAVRSLAGVIDRVGLLRREHATERGVQLAYRHYQNGPDTVAAAAFARRFCHAKPMIEMIGVWDTVKSLGLPLFGFGTLRKHAFHSHHLGNSIRHGFQALAIHETRSVFEPVPWDSPETGATHVQQMWFRGAHGDIGGMIGDDAAARPLANIPLVWMLDQAQGLGLDLPENWHARFPCDPAAPMVGTLRGWGALFLLRRKRRMLRDRSEAVHPSAQQARVAGGWLSALTKRG